MTLLDPAGHAGHEPNPGYHWEWHPEPTEGYHAWRVEPEGDGRRCRWQVARHQTCGAPLVARLLLSTKGRYWWHYCGDHLYGRVIHDGRVWALRLVPDEEAT
jgi:hypothetical protein